jgi:hypothetical protein
MQFFQPPITSAIPLGPNMLVSPTGPKQSQSASSLSCDISGFIPIENKRKNYSPVHFNLKGTKKYLKIVLG